MALPVFLGVTSHFLSCFPFLLLIIFYRFHILLPLQAAGSEQFYPFDMDQKFQMSRRGWGWPCTPIERGFGKAWTGKSFCFLDKSLDAWSVPTMFKLHPCFNCCKLNFTYTHTELRKSSVTVCYIREEVCYKLKKKKKKALKGLQKLQYLI
jgi:hypothetical protein